MPIAPLAPATKTRTMYLLLGPRRLVSGLPGDLRMLDAQREFNRLSTDPRASGDFAHSPATCLVLTLRRFQTLTRAIERIKAASDRHD